MRSKRSLSWIAVALPLAASGQEMPGIDLAKPRPAEEVPLPPPPPGTTQRPQQAPGALESAVGVPGEGDAALGDRVKAVQRKGFLKQGRLQLTALFAPTVNDPFYQKFGLGGRLAYNVADSFAVAARGTYYLQVETPYKREAVQAFQSLLLASRPNGEVMGEGLWSPVYGKFSWFDRSIVHFDMYLAAGFGAAWSASSSAKWGGGAHPAAEFGGGMRFYPLDFLAAEFGVLGTFYPDQAGIGVPPTIQKILCVNFGLSFFFPTRFEYVYP